ncbi:MAG: MerR family transcriptional regulator, partial [Thermoleophilia bacterium]|nr:MerR family transcriptional regulator [Thermoleophilia bacterium]
MNIQAVANRTGVPSATLRKWEQRYRVLAPERTVGAHRRYSERDVARVEWLKARLAEGYRIGEAARLLGGDSATVASDPAELADALVSAAREGDVARISHALDQAFRLLPREHAILHVAEPALKRVGELWAAGELRVADEHAVSELTRGKVRALLDGAVAGPRGRIVLCCVPAERHELGLLMLAALLHADGWAVLYLGADTPLREALALAQANGARALCVSATLAES